MGITSFQAGAGSARAGRWLGAGRWRILAAALFIPASLVVTSGASTATTTPNGGVKTTLTAHVAHKTMAWFKQQLAADYSLKTAGTIPTTAPTHKKGEKIWVISCGQATPACALPVVSAVAAGKRLGWKMTSCDGNFGIADAYDNCIRSAIAAGANGVEIESTDCNQAYSGMLELKAKGIPLVGYESFDCSDSLGYISKQKVFTGNVLYTKTYPTAAALSLQAGRAAADYLVVHDNGMVNAINTVFSVVAAEYADRGFVQELSRCATCKILTTIKFSPPDIVPGGTFSSEFSAALVANPTANAAYVWPDGVINESGLIQAVDAVGRGSNLCIVSSQDGAGPTNDAAIQAGNAECADGALDNLWIGYALNDEMIRVLAHQPMAYEGMGPVLISKDHNMAPAGQNWAYPGVNVVASYKKAWGLK